MSRANVEAFKRSIEAYNRGDVGDRVVAVGRLTIRGRGSGLPSESPFGWLGEFSNGKATRIRTYLNPDEALAIAGLDPDGR